MADSVAIEGQILVGPVFPPIAGRELFTNFVAGAFDERTDESVFSNRADGGKACRGRSPQESVQDRFGLIGGGVTERDAVEVEIGRASCRERVSYHV